MPALGTSGLSSDTALGDWYINRIVVHRQPLLLMVSSTSLLPILIPARNVLSLPDRIADLVQSRLVRRGVEAGAIEAERRAMSQIEIGPTVNRSVLGIMTDFAKSVSYHLSGGNFDETTLLVVEESLASTPCYASRTFDRVIFPERKAPELLRMKWLDNTPLPPAIERRGS